MKGPMMDARKPLLACLLVATLTACGGGGGGGGGGGDGGGDVSTPDFDNPIDINDVDIPIGIEFSGTAIEANLPGGIGAFSAPDTNATIERTSENELLIISHGETVTIDLNREVDIRTLTFDGNQILIPGYEGALFLQVDLDDEDELAYTEFGGWSATGGSGSPAVDEIRFGAFGNQTPQSGLPGTSAEFKGESIGIATIDNGSGGTAIGFTSSDITVTTPDFTTVEITSRGTEFSSLDTSTLSNPEVLDFVATGRVSGTGFTATPTNAGRTGQVDGQFYGPKAEEVGGTFGLTGSNVIYGGAFGAKR